MRNGRALHFFDFEGAVALLRKYERGRRIIGFPLARSCFAGAFKFTKNDTAQALEEMREKGKIEIIRFHGVRILNMGGI